MTFEELAAWAWPRLRWTAYLLTGDLDAAEDLATRALARTLFEWRHVRRGTAHAHARRALLSLVDDISFERRVVVLRGAEALSDDEVARELHATLEDVRAVEAEALPLDTLPASAPDLPAIRRIVHERRSRRRTVVLAVVAALAVVAGVARTLDRPAPVPAPAVATTTQVHRLTTVSAYERRLLDRVPGSFEVDGTVVVPGLPSDQHPVPSSRVVGTPRALGFHVYTPLAAANRPPTDSQVVADRGAGHLACVREQRSGCEPTVLVRDAQGRWSTAYGLGAGFSGGAGLRVFLGDDYQSGTWHPTVIGGLPGTDVSRVRLTLVDGTSAHAVLDRGRLRAGTTLFWYDADRAVTDIRAYDGDGHLVAERRVRACSDVNCLVR